MGLSTTARGSPPRSPGRHAFRLQAEIVERSLAHNLDRGGIGGTRRRRQESSHKCYLVHIDHHTRLKDLTRVYRLTPNCDEQDPSQFAVRSIATQAVLP
jgi:hypothetical protein